MKRTKLYMTGVVTALALLAACNTAPPVTVVPTPTLAAEPTAAPTIEPTVTAEPTATPTIEPTATTAPTATVTPEPTATSTPTPTEPPHEHTWVLTEVAATCTTDGSTVETCECGEEQNAATIPALGHVTEKKVTKEATVDEEGAWEEACAVCGEVVDSGKVDKLVPTATPSPEPTATPTPKPTSTPKPTATPKPTKKPTPTATPKPTSTPAPTRIPVESYTWWDVNHELIRYTDESHTKIEKLWYDLNLASEYIVLYNYSDVKGAPQEVKVYDYPSYDAKVVDTMELVEKDLDNPTISKRYRRGQEKVTHRCVETGWYRVLYNGNKIGYVDDEYVYCGFAFGGTADGRHYPAVEYCQFEMPYIGHTHELKQPEDITIAVGENVYHDVRPKSLNLYYYQYFPELRDYYEENAKLVGVFSVEDSTIVEIIPDRWNGFYQEGLGCYMLNGAYRAYFTGKKAGTTAVILTEYEISNYQYNDGKPTFTLEEQTNQVTFTITVTE